MEDLNEPIYKIDKMFQQLINISQFKHNCKGIVVGDFIGIDNNAWLEEFLCELSSKMSLPMIRINSITHSKQKITLPIGRIAEIQQNKLVVKNR